MKLSMRRIVLFTRDMPKMIAFYREILGLRLLKDEPGWKELDADGCVIALHNGSSQVGKRPPRSGSGPAMWRPRETLWSPAGPSSAKSCRAAA